MSAAAAPPTPAEPKSTKSHELATRTLRSPAWSYARIEAITTTDSSGNAAAAFPDPLTARAHIASALRQFLGARGDAVGVDVLSLVASSSLDGGSGREGGGRGGGNGCWVRVARDDAPLLAAAVAAWRGTSSSPEAGGGSGVGGGGGGGGGGDGSAAIALRVAACSDWLGALVGAAGQDAVWSA